MLKSQAKPQDNSFSPWKLFFPNKAHTDGCTFSSKSLSFQAATPFLRDHCEQDPTDEEPIPWPSFQGQTPSIVDIKRYFIYSSLLLSQLFLLIIIALYSIIGTGRKTTLNTPSSPRNYFSCMLQGKYFPLY